MKRPTITILAFILVIAIASAADYHITPMNFPTDSSRDLNITVSSPGDIINVTYSPSFTLSSGSPDGNGSVSFILASPASSTNGDIHYINVSINDTFLDRLTAIAVPDIEIVDNKWEIGHGDFNYPDCAYIPNESMIIFPLIRVYSVGTDVLNEVAENVTFTCNYPDIRPRTVDNKFTVDYSNPIEATGLLDRMKSTSLFRLFILSQEIDLNSGDNYEVTCSDLSYDFDHHTVQAEVATINLSVVGTNPFTITTTTTTNYVEYNITNTASYEIRDIEFEWKLNSLVHREKKDNMDPGESVRYRVWANDNPTIMLNIRQKPCWMFNSRSPTFYETVHSASYSINTNTTEIFTIEERLFYDIASSESSITNQLTAIGDDIDDLLFLFRINTPEFHVTVSRLPESQQNKLNFTCFKLALRSNGIVNEPHIEIQTQAPSEDDVIVMNEFFQTKVFDFTLDHDGFGIVRWDSELGICTEDVAPYPNYRCPVKNNYICLREGIPEELVIKQEEVPEKKEDLPISLRQRLIDIGSLISPRFPELGFGVILLIISAIIYAYFYYEKELDLKKWITEQRQTKERKKYVDWRKKQKEERIGSGRLF